ncbi:hypothetical protein CDD83_2623 [Cordyceps sp. RAO-2017]|nr:hypothetical protein CDD83_2623 [Cordyceps sp. RAO-2017]
MLLGPLDKGRHTRFPEVARTIDGDLLSVCSNSRRAVKFVADRKAPSLLAYLDDRAKATMQSWDADAAAAGEARSCHGVAFEAWAFWLYSLVGQLGNDRDLERYGIQSNVQAVTGPFVLPSKPFASLFLGHSGQEGIAMKPCYVSRGPFATRRYMFIRSGVLQGQQEAEPLATRRTRRLNNDAAAHAKLPLCKLKKRRLGDILQSMAGS